MILTHPLFGAACGVAFGLLSAASMLPMTFPDKRAALLGAFLNRFAIGVAIGFSTGATDLPGWVVGLLLGLLISAGDAVITKAYVPILAIGAVGGAGIGYVTAAFGG